MGYRVYGEEKDDKEYPVTEFFMGFLIGGPGFYLAGGWVLSSWGLMSERHLAIACGIIGIATGCKFAWNSLVRRRKKENG